MMKIDLVVLFLLLTFLSSWLRSARSASEDSSDLYVNTELDATIWRRVAATGGNIVWRKMDVADTNNAGPSIKVIQPKDMDTLYERNSFTIKWDSTGLDGVNGKARCLIRLYEDHFHPNKYVKTIAYNVDLKAGEYEWKDISVPEALGVDRYYKVVISSLENTHVHGANQGKIRVLAFDNSTDWYLAEDFFNL